MKKALSILLMFALLLCLTACGGEKKADEPTASADSIADVAAKYSLDLASASEQAMSDERAATDVLVSVMKDWLGGNTFFAYDAQPKTYADFVEHIGCDASYYYFNEGAAERHFVWLVEGDDTAKFLASFKETSNGWTLDAIGSTNIK